jgi:putative acetyltransferase
MACIIRPFRTSDAEAIAALTLAAIRVTALRAYSPEQVAAWSARYTVQRLRNGAAKGEIILVAADADDRPIAYTVLEASGHIEMLYCHPDHTGQGLGARLLAEAEMAARAAGMARLSAEASELARPVFARAGFALLHRREFTIGPDTAPVAIHNYAMAKQLA